MGQMKASLFDLDEARARKAEGMSLAADNQPLGLDLARVIAATLGRRCGEVDADMVGRILKREHGIESLGPAAGSKQLTRIRSLRPITHTIDGKTFADIQNAMKGQTDG